MNDNVLALILGGGQGSRLFPLTQQRSKPAVPIGGKYRLIDVPISNCLHADIRRIFVLTQFNSASLNHHVGQSYRMDPFGEGFVDILAAEQTPDNPNWFQGTADAVRQAARHFARYDVSYYLILAGDHLYRMDYREIVDAHVRRMADITIAARRVGAEDALSMGIFRFDTDGRIIGFEEKPPPERLQAIGRSIPPNSTFGALAPGKPDQPFVASLGMYVFSRDVLLDMLSAGSAADFGRELIPAALDQYQVDAFLFDGYWADVGTVESFYDANIMLTRPDAPFRFHDAQRPFYTRPRILPGSRLRDCSVRDAVIAEGCTIDRSTIAESIVGIRTRIREGASIRRSVLLGADFYEDDRPDNRRPSLGIGRDVELDRVIVDKNARIGDGSRLVNADQVRDADGPGYFIRNGVIVVPKDGIIEPGTIV